MKTFQPGKNIGKLY